MALDVELLGIDWTMGKYSLRKVSTCIGRPADLIRHPSIRVMSLTPGYSDYAGVLSRDEVREMALAYYRDLDATRTSDERAEWKGHDPNTEVEAALQGVDFVVVHVFEWESGM